MNVLVQRTAAPGRIPEFGFWIADLYRLPQGFCNAKTQIAPAGSLAPHVLDEMLSGVDAPIILAAATNEPRM
jgi:hypothetical protein